MQYVLICLKLEECSEAQISTLHVYQGYHKFSIIDSSWMGGCCFSSVNVFYFVMETALLEYIKRKIATNGETVYTRRCICQKYMVPEESKLAKDEEEASGIIQNVMDILYIFRNYPCILCIVQMRRTLPVNNRPSISAVKKSIDCWTDALDLVGQWMLATLCKQVTFLFFT